MFAHVPAAEFYICLCQNPLKYQPVFLREPSLASAKSFGAAAE
jgi:hypothetical protein